MIAVPGYEGRPVGVLGLGRSGLATARALRACGAVPRLWDDRGDTRRAAEADGWLLRDLARPREAAENAALIVSPGIPHLYPAPHPAVAAAQAAGVPVDNEIGLFFRALAEMEPEAPEPKVVAVTGSNGKSTTTALIAHLLRAAGRPVQMGGNIGRAALDLDPPGPGGNVVLELSSYQTELALSLAPDIAVFLNLQPDHLDRHGGLGGYFAAKRRLFEAGAPERAIIGIDQPEGRFLAARTDPDALIRVSVEAKPKDDGWSVFLNKAFLTEWRRGKQIAALDLRTAPALAGRHNAQNACAAYAVGRALGLAPSAIEAGLATFAGLAHRMERIGTGREILWVNDSKATNAAAAGHALAAFPAIRWIAGGLAKEDGAAGLSDHAPRIAHAYLYGAAAERFAREIAPVPASRFATLAEATEAAAHDAQPGETVLLSPACASFDQFLDFEARGEAFRALAAAYLESDR